MITTRKKNLQYRRDTKILQAKPNDGYGRPPSTPPPSHYNRYFSVRNTYSSWSKDASDLTASNSYEVATGTKFLHFLWMKIRPEVDSTENDVWLESLYKPQKARLEREIRWGNSNGKDIIDFLCEEISLYYENFNREEHKPLLLRLIMMGGE